MTKLQLICKYKGMEYPDHLIEFVILSGENSGGDLIKHQRNIANRVHGLYLDTIDELITGNVNALLDRYDLIGTISQHKWFNHVQRMKYLNAFFYKECSQESIVFFLSCLAKINNYRAFSYEGEALAKIKNDLYGNLIKTLIHNKLYINEYIKTKKGYFITKNDERRDRGFLAFNKVPADYDALMVALQIPLKQYGAPEIRTMEREGGKTKKKHRVHKKNKSKYKN
jgi:hypothetical protein